MSLTGRNDNSISLSSSMETPDWVVSNSVNLFWHKEVDQKLKACERTYSFSYFHFKMSQVHFPQMYLSTK